MGRSLFYQGGGIGLRRGTDGVFGQDRLTRIPNFSSSAPPGQVFLWTESIGAGAAFDEESALVTAKVGLGRSLFDQSGDNIVL